MNRVVDFFVRESLLVILLLLLVIISIMEPGHVHKFHQWVEWKVIATLIGLMVLTAGLSYSGFFDVFSRRIIRFVGTERTLALFLVLLSFFLSPVLTNDMALFVVVPLTLAFSRGLENDISKIVIMEALAVNSGSALFPIGNPQNIYLWHRWGISFWDFVAQMLIPVSVMLFLLLAFVFLLFPSRKLRLSADTPSVGFDARLFILSALLMPIFVFLVDRGLSIPASAVVISIYLIFFRYVLLRVDWLLVVLFILIFMDFGALAHSRLVHHSISPLIENSSETGVYITSILLSQFISNVPAAVFLSHFFQNWKILAYGVNVGGNGTVIASLASIIALRLGKVRRGWLLFHVYSIPFLIMSAIGIYVLIIRGF